MNVTLKKGRLRGSISAPPSKSFAHRSLIAGMLSLSFVSGISPSEDMEATLDCASAFGAKFHQEEDNVSFLGLDNPVDTPTFPCHESGSTLRFFLPLALTRFQSFTLSGSSRLLDRGVPAYEECLKEKGISIARSERGIEVKGKLSPGEFILDASSSSQYVTGLLFALPLLPGDSILRLKGPAASRPYIDISLQVLRDFGICIEEKENAFFIKGKQSYKKHDAKVEGDYSNAAFLEAFAFLGQGVSVTGLNPTSVQGDKVASTHFASLKKGFAEISLESCIDLAPVLFAFAALNHGARFSSIKRLAIKESSRGEAMKEELEKAGCSVSIQEDEAVVLPSNSIPSSLLFSSHNDHRIAMALSLFSLFADVTIMDAGCVKKSYPNYFEALSSLGLEVSYHE